MSNTWDIIITKKNIVSLAKNEEQMRRYFIEKERTVPVEAARPPYMCMYVYVWKNGTNK